MKVVAMTCLCVDIFDGTDEIRPGGEALNFSANISSYQGIQSYIIGAVGADSYGKVILDSIQSRPIHKDYIHVMNGTTANNRTYLTNEGDRYYKADSWNGGVYQEFQLCESDRMLMRNSDLVHTTIHCPIWKDIVEVKKSGDFYLSVDFDILRDFEK